MKFKEGNEVIYTVTNEKLTVISNNGFFNKGNRYIPCADKDNEIDDYSENDLVLFDGDETKHKIQNLINVLSDEQKVLAIQLIDNSINGNSFIQTVSQNFANEIQKSQQTEGIILGWWNFVKNKYPLIYRK